MPKHLVGFAFLLGGVVCSGTAKAQTPDGFFTDVKPVAGLEGPWRDEGPYVTRNGLTIYFDSERPNMSSQIETSERDIWMASRTLPTDAFGTPIKVESVSVDGVSDHYPYLSENGLTMYFNSGRGDGTTTYSTTRGTPMDEWSTPTPVLLGLASPPDQEARGIRFSSNGLRAVFDRTEGATSDLYEATRESASADFGPAEPLLSLNTPNFEEWGADISADGLTLLFARAEAGYIRPQIYVASRGSANEDFGSPQRIDSAFPGGSRINFAGATFDPFLTSDWPAAGSKLYFASTDSYSDFDIFEATWQPIPEPSSLFLALCAVLGGYAFKRKHPKALLCLCVTMFFASASTNIARAQRTVVSPGEFATKEAPNGVDISSVPSYRLQQVYGAADFESLGPGPHIITRVDWRPGSEMTETVSYPAERFEMKFSTTQIDPGDVLDRTFDTNIGSGERTVFDGPVTLTTENLGPAEGPKAFDYGLDLQPPFFAYDPAAGNLLMDLTVTNGQGPLLLDSTFSDTNTTSFHWSGRLGADSEVAALVADFGGQTGGHIIQFTVVPEPTSMAIMSGCVLLALIRRRRES